MGWVRTETLGAGNTTMPLFYCNYCDYGWRRMPDGKDVPLPARDSELLHDQLTRKKSPR